MLSSYLLRCIFAAFILISFQCGKKKCIEPGNGVSEVPSYSDDIQPILTAKCATSGCHDDATASGGLSLTAEEAYAQLIDIPSILEANMIRVSPGDAQNSYLVIKLENRQTVGEAMPLVGSISSDELQLIKNWIDDGAENN